MQTILEFLFGWLPEASYSVNISVDTPLDKAKAFLLCAIAGHLIYHYVLKPGVKIVWAIVVGLVCAISLHALAIYAAYKFGRLREMRWLMLVPYLFERWLDFTFAGYKGTTITSKYFIWRGPFNWALVAQNFKTEPTVGPESDDLSDDDGDDFVHLTPEQMRESDARDEAAFNEHPDDALLRKLHEPVKEKVK
jgi:hypothetical protein